MRKAQLIVTVIVTAAVLAISGLMALVLEAEQDLPEKNEAMKAQGLGVSMVTDKATYAPGDTIALKLSVFNYTKEKVTLHFSSAQRYDFIIEDRKGNKVWRWSDERMFAQVLGEETLGPGREEISYTASYEGELKPGEYKIIGLLVAKDRPMSASVSVVVK